MKVICNALPRRACSLGFVAVPQFRVVLSHSDHWSLSFVVGFNQGFLSPQRYPQLTTQHISYPVTRGLLTVATLLLRTLNLISDQWADTASTLIYWFLSLIPDINLYQFHGSGQKLTKSPYILQPVWRQVSVTRQLAKRSGLSSRKVFPCCA